VNILANVGTSPVKGDVEDADLTVQASNLQRDEL